MRATRHEHAPARRLPTEKDGAADGMGGERRGRHPDGRPRQGDARLVGANGWDQPRWPWRSPRDVRAPAGGDARRGRPDVAALLGRELERQRGQIELIASENFTWPAVFEAQASVADEQVRRGLPRPALLRRLRGRRRDRAAGDRPGEGALRRRARERPAARGRADEHGRLLRLPPARRHDPRHAARSRRPPDARPQGELLRAALHGRDLRRRPRDRAHRLRRGSARRRGARGRS